MGHKIEIEGFEFDEESLKKLRAKLTWLYYIQRTEFEKFMEFLMSPTARIDEGLRRLLLVHEIFDDKGQLPPNTLVAVHLMIVNKGGDKSKYPLGWVTPTGDAQCDHREWQFAGMWEDIDGNSRIGGPRAFCTECGYNKRFRWNEVKDLVPYRIIGLPT